MRLPLIVLLVAIGLAGCARSRSSAPETPPASPLARAAWDEWRAWNGPVIDGWPDTRPADMRATPERMARLEAYWSILPGGWRIAQRHQDTRNGLIALQDRLNAEHAGEEGDGAAPMVVVAGLDDMAMYNYPAWSAAFISYVARSAGVPEWELPSSSRHASYIDAVIARYYASPETSAYVPQAPEEIAPRVGDLVCADRAWVRLNHWTERISERGRGRPMHCDVVVRTAPGRVEAIGGNVQAMVARRIFPADAQGRLLPAPFDRPGFIVVLAARENHWTPAPVPSAR